MSRVVIVFLAFASPLGLGGCGGVGQGTGAGKLAARLSVSKLFPAPVPIVKVSERDLKELPLGHERALAYDRQRKAGLWALGGAVDFVQPKLPEAGAEMDGSLLPPKDP